METSYQTLIRNWPKHVKFVDGELPVLVLSTHELSSSEKEKLCADYIGREERNIFSSIISLKMVHVYFRLGRSTFDYRPHRGKLSGLYEQSYRVPNSDRVETCIQLSDSEMNRLNEYFKNIRKSPLQTLGKPYPFSLREHDWTVLDYQTVGKLDHNPYINPEVRHNCLTWLTTAPIGDQQEKLWEMLGMTPETMAQETHSYIVAFYRHLTTVSSVARVPLTIWWTTHSTEDALEKLKNNPNFIRQFYSPTIPTQIGPLPIEQTQPAVVHYGSKPA